MAEQLLDGAQITAACEQMRGETMAQRMGGGGFGQAERAAQQTYFFLDNLWSESAAARAPENSLACR